MENNDEWELGRKVKYYNGTLQKLRLERGLNLGQASELIGISKQTLCFAETMRHIPNPDIMEKIEKFYGVPKEKLFPIEFLKLMRTRDKEEVEYAKTEIHALESYATKQTLLLEESSSPELTMLGTETHEKIMEAINTLTDREQKIIKMRFGFNGEQSKSLREVGIEFGTTQERIRQIEAKALSKLRKTDTLKKYRSAFFNDTDEMDEENNKIKQAKKDRAERLEYCKRRDETLRRMRNERAS